MKKALAIALGLSLAQSMPVQAQSAVSAPPQATVQEPTFDVYEYVIEGNTVLPSSVVERAVTPFMGPARRFADLEQAETARFYRPVGRAGRLFLEVEASAFQMI